MYTLTLLAQSWRMASKQLVRRAHFGVNERRHGRRFAIGFITVTFTYRVGQSLDQAARTVRVSNVLDFHRGDEILLDAAGHGAEESWQGAMYRDVELRARCILHGVDSCDVAAILRHLQPRQTRTVTPVYDRPILCFGSDEVTS